MTRTNHLRIPKPSEDGIVMRCLPSIDAIVGTTIQRLARYSTSSVQRRSALGAAVLMIVFGFPFVETAQAQLQGAAGNVRVNIEWYEDVDLHPYVTDPCGNKFGYGERTTEDCGGFTGRMGSR